MTVGYFASLRMTDKLNWRQIVRWVPLFAVTLLAFWLRARELDRRPMHADEANQAVKLGELLDAGHYAFDPRDHHGPTLYFAAAPVAWLRGERSLAKLTETTVRLVPAIFGTISVVLIALIYTAGESNQTLAIAPRWPGLAAAAFVAVSPPSVYYSRYFIQETLLVTFTLAAVFCAMRWSQTRHARWAVCAGVFAGLMQATKASAPLFVAAALLAWLCSRTLKEKRAAGATSIPAPSRARATAIALVAAMITAGLLYSTFGTHPAGLRDALATYTQAFTRFGANAAPTGHEKPWWYYLSLFGRVRTGGFVWEQVAFSALALAGLGVAFVQRARFPRAVAIYALTVAVAFSLFAYKTPWHATHFVPGMALLGAIALARVAQLRTGKLVAAAAFVVVLGTLGKQTALAAFQRPADQRNPYAYVHSSPDVLKVRPLAEAALQRFPDGAVRVISEEYWPLPWYLRGLPRVGFWSTPPDDCDGALVITSTAQAERVRARLRDRYRESFLGLRPGVLMVVFTRDIEIEGRD